MDQNRCPEPGADVGRARGQVAKLIVEGIGNSVTQFRVETFEDAEGIRNMEPGVERLKAQMVLFVDHDPDAARQIDGCARPYWLVVEACQLLADQMAFMKQQPVLRRQLVDAHQ